MMKMSTKKNKILPLIIACCALFALINSTNVFAAGWVGFGGGGPMEIIPGEGGGGGGDCESKPTQIGCRGYSWVFYEYVGIPGATIRFVPDANTVSYGSTPPTAYSYYVVPAECTDLGEGGGFWHFGGNGKAVYNASFGDNFWRQNYLTSLAHKPAADAYYTTAKGYYGHARNMKPGKVKSSWPHLPTPDSLLNHTINDLNGNQYTATHSGADLSGQVLTDFKKACAADATCSSTYGATVNSMTSIMQATEVWGFCSGPGLKTGPDATFVGKVQAYVNGAPAANGSFNNVPEDSKVTIKFVHNIRRENNGPDSAVSNNWSTSVSGGGTNGSGTVSLSKNGSVDLQIGGKTTDEFIVDAPVPGDVKTFCQTLYYDARVTSDGAHHQTSTAQYCVHIRVNHSTPGNFWPVRECHVFAPTGVAKSNECDTFAETNSRTWGITHKGWTDTSLATSGQKIPAGTATGVHATYNRKGSSKTKKVYSTSETCVRSSSNFTKWWWTGADGSTSSGLTLEGTSSLDMPYDKSGNTTDDNYHWDGTYDYVNDYDKGCKTYYQTWDPVQKKYVDTSNCKEYYKKPVKHYAYYYPGCESGKTYWYKWNKSEKSTSWGTEKADDDLIIDYAPSSRPADDKKESGRRCSNYSVASSYSDGTWAAVDGVAVKDSLDACNWVIRWRRYVHFNRGTPDFRADVGIKSVATKKRTPGYDLDTTNDNGEFTITITHSINRGETENVKDPGGEKYKVTNHWYGQLEYVAVDGSGQIYNRNHINPDTGEVETVNAWRDFGEFVSNHAPGTENIVSRIETISGKLYYGQRIKICSRIKYGKLVREQDKRKDGKWVDGSEIHEWNGTNGEEAGCIIVHRDDQNCGNVIDDETSPSYYFTHQWGDNVAKIGVVNDTTNPGTYRYTKWKYNGTNTVKTARESVYARPGDNIRYHVEYCMGANYAHAVHLANEVPDGVGFPPSGDTVLKGKGDLAGQNTTDTNRVDATHRDHYLFISDLSSLIGGKTIPKTFNFIKMGGDGVGGIDEDATIDDSNTIGSKNSPSDGVNRYKCPNSVSMGLSPGTPFLNDHYQIAGKMKKVHEDIYYENDLGDEFYNDYVIDGCGTNLTQSLDVGRSLSEEIRWTNMRVSDVHTATIKAENSHIALARVPYNYTAEPYLINQSTPTGTVQIGGKMTTTPGIVVYPRKNCAFINGFYDGTMTNDNVCKNAPDNPLATYATITKPTTVKFDITVKGPTTDLYFKGPSIVVRANIKSNLQGTAQNTSLSLNAGGHRFDKNLVFDVPNNIQPGDQVCIKMTITPADSHNSPDKQRVYGASQVYTDSEDKYSYDKVFWALRDTYNDLPTGHGYALSTATATTCSTAVKRPNMSAEDSNLYSATNISTSVVARHNLVSYFDEAHSEVRWKAGTEYLFGSWSEYAIFGKVVTGNGTSSSESVSRLGTGSGAAYGYPQNSYWLAHHGARTVSAIEPTYIVEYDAGPKKGVYKYNWKRISINTARRHVKYKYTTDLTNGTHKYIIDSVVDDVIVASASNANVDEPTVNAANTEGAAPQEGNTICRYSTQTFANTMCDNPTGDAASAKTVGSNGIGTDAASIFTENILDRYGKVSDSDISHATKVIAKTNYKTSTTTTYYDLIGDTAIAAGKLEGDNEAAMYKSVNGNAIIGASGGTVDLATLNVLSEGVESLGTLGISAKSVMVYKAKTIVINADIKANDDKKNGASDFRMPIIIADRVWITGNPTRIDAIIIAKKELNTCKWNTYSDFLNGVPIEFPADASKNGGPGIMNSNMCNKELKFTAPVVVGDHKNTSTTDSAKLILNRTYGAGGADGGGDQYRRAEIFELSPATYLWSYAEMSRYSQAITTYSRELPSRY